MKSLFCVVAILAVTSCTSEQAGQAFGSFAKGFEKSSADIQADQAERAKLNPPPAAAKSGTLCSLKSQYVSGSNRICNYECGGSFNPVTQPAASVCQTGMMKY